MMNQPPPYAPQAQAAPAPVHPAPTTVIIQTVPAGPRVYDQYRAGQSKFMGWAQIIIGLASIFFWGLAIYFDSLNNTYEYMPFLTFTGAGIWSGLFFILPGAFGVVAAKRKTMCPIVAFMVLSIVALVLIDPIYIGWAVASAVINFYSNDICDDGYRYNGCRRNYGLTVTSVICAILSLVYFVVALWSSIICCMGVCCKSPTVTQTGQHGQVAYVAGGAISQQPGAVQYVHQGQSYSIPQQQQPQAYGNPQQQPQAYGYPQQQPQANGYPQQQPQAYGYPQEALPQGKI